MFLELREHLLRHLLLNKIRLAIEHAPQENIKYLLPNARVEGHYDLVH